MTSVEALSPPFATWQEGLLALISVLHDRDRARITVARLEATTAKNGVSLKEICALALMVPSRARFDTESLPKAASHPLAVEMGSKLAEDELFNKRLTEILDAHETVARTRVSEIEKACRLTLIDNRVF